jgi:plasmid replication initiation protein
MIVHTQDAKSAKQAWNTLVKMYITNTQACKMQFKQELHNLQKNKMNIIDNSTKGEKPYKCFCIYRRVKVSLGGTTKNHLKQ